MYSVGNNISIHSCDFSFEFQMYEETNKIFKSSYIYRVIFIYSMIICTLTKDDYNKEI